MKLDTRPSRKLTSREIATLLGWIPVQAIQVFGREETKAVISDLRALAQESEGLSSEDSRSLVQAVHELTWPLLSFYAALGSLIAYQQTSKKVDLVGPHPISDALTWILEHLDGYTIPGEQNDTEEKSN